MIGEHSFFGVPKTPEQIESQLNKVQEQLGHEPEHALVPTSVGREEILRMPVCELQEKYARRYHAYIELLRHKNDADFVSRDKLIADFKKWFTALNSLESYISKHHAGIDVTLRGKQIDVFDDLHKFLEAGGTAGYVKLPTGVGKTVLFTELIEALDLKTLIVVPTNILVDQTVDKAEQFAPDIDLGIINAKAKEYGRKVTVTTYASLAIQVRNGQIKPEDFDCLILDEAHEALSSARKNIVRSFFTNAAVIGFTATPDYSAGKRLADLLPEVIHTMELRESIEAGLSCPVSVVIVKTDVDVSKVKKTAAGDYSEGELEKVVNVVARNKAAVLLYKDYFLNELAVAYCVGIKHAHAVARVFREAGIAASAISGETPKNEQHEILKRFAHGKIKVLCNADLLIRGFDEPHASVCLNLRPTPSIVNAEQRGGRVLRIDPYRPDKHAAVIDFLDVGSSEEEFELRGQILFSKILGGSFVGLQGSEDDWVRDKWKRESEDVKEYYIPGVEVIYDAEEVLRITRHMDEKETSVKKESVYIEDLEDLQKEVRAAGIKNSTDYFKRKPDYPLWPYHPQKLPGWTNWYDFCGNNQNKVIEDLEDLQKEVRAAGIRDSRDYNAKMSQHPLWPSQPYKLPGWINWDNFFGKQSILDLKQLQKEVRLAGVIDGGDYVLKRRLHSTWPKSPRTLPGWISWQDLCGNSNVISNLRELQKMVREVGIKESREYFSKRLEHPEWGWPSVPKDLPGWTNWYDFLGTEI